MTWAAAAYRWAASRAIRNSPWMEQVARNATMQDTGYLNGCRYLLHDRDKNFCREFRETLAAGGVKCAAIPARSSNLNAHAERWVRSIKEECLSKLIYVWGELVPPRRVRFPGALSPRKKPPRQRQSRVLPRPSSAHAGSSTSSMLSRVISGLTQVLRQRRMNILAKRS